MPRSSLWIFASLLLILGVPFLLRPADSAQRDPQAVRLIIVTPHIEQIRHEFGIAFDRWHRRVHGVPAIIDWRAPGGTSEIIKQLEAQYTAALKSGRYQLAGTPEKPEFIMGPGTVGYDLMFGGGSFDHTRLKQGVPFKLDTPGGGKDVRVPMSVPAGFAKDQLDAWFGENTIGAGNLYDPEQYWIGTALSSFGIVFNRDALQRLGLPEPTSFSDLTDPRYIGQIALADPRQSGSVTTTLDSILNNYGWEKGWRILRELSANTRYFTNSAPKPPIDVSAGEAAAGLAIDFYGRGQAQYVGDDRVGYVDPVGTTYIDADPVSLLRGAPHPEIAKRFIEFCMSEEAQALWQFAPGSGPSADALPGPQLHALRRMPARRVMYEKYQSRFVDRTLDPFNAASKTTVKGWRPGIGLMMGAFAIDVADDQRAAWAALTAARAAKGLDSSTLARLEQLFYAWPETPGVDGTSLAFTQENFKAIRDLWRDADRQARLRIAYTTFFRTNYRTLVAEARAAGVTP